MVDTNYILGIVKILENPRQRVLKDNILIGEFRGQLPQIRNNLIINLVCWGNLAQDMKKYYQMNDYIIIEGYISLRDKKINNSSLKKINITVLKVYPFLLNYNR